MTYYRMRGPSGVGRRVVQCKMILKGYGFIQQDRNIFLSPTRASSNARTLDSLPTTKGVIMCGKMTTSRIGIMGSRRVSDFSLIDCMRVWVGKLLR